MQKEKTEKRLSFAGWRTESRFSVYILRLKVPVPAQDSEWSAEPSGPSEAAFFVCSRSAALLSALV